jgi:hypothetical protein
MLNKEELFERAEEYQREKLLLDIYRDEICKKEGVNL